MVTLFEYYTVSLASLEKRRCGAGGHTFPLPRFNAQGGTANQVQSLLDSGTAPRRPLVPVRPHSGRAARAPQSLTTTTDLAPIKPGRHTPRASDAVFLAEAELGKPRGYPWQFLACGHACKLDLSGSLHLSESSVDKRAELGCRGVLVAVCCPVRRQRGCAHGRPSGGRTGGRLAASPSRTPWRVINELPA